MRTENRSAAMTGGTEAMTIVGVGRLSFMIMCRVRRIVGQR